jgi:hypothetical protein
MFLNPEDKERCKNKNNITTEEEENIELFLNGIETIDEENDSTEDLREYLLPEDYQDFFSSLEEEINDRENVELDDDLTNDPEMNKNFENFDENEVYMIMEQKLNGTSSYDNNDQNYIGSIATLDTNEAHFLNLSNKRDEENNCEEYFSDLNGTDDNVDEEDGII